MPTSIGSRHCCAFWAWRWASRAGRVDEYWRAGCALAVRLAADLAVGYVGRPEEGEGATLVFLAEHVERKAPGRLYGSCRRLSRS